MKVKKVDLKKIISYLLIFTVFFTTVQLGNMKSASAGTATNQVPGLTLHIGDLNGDIKIIDRNSTDTSQYQASSLKMGTTFTLQPEASSYTITSVISDNPSDMKINSDGTNYTISSITNYSDFMITVTIQDNSKSPATSVEYPIKMQFQSDASLEFGTLKYTLDGQEPVTYPYTQKNSITGNYEIKDVEASVKTIKLQLLDTNQKPITFKVNGSADAVENSVNLSGGENIIVMSRTYLNITKKYTLVVTKKGEAKLQTLVPSVGTLSPAFKSDNYDYEITVPTTQSTIAFTPTAIDNSSTIKINGTSVLSGKKSSNISLDEGENKVKIILVTKYGDTNTYTVNIIRTEKFRSALLTGLTLTQGTLTPTFNKGVYEYNSTVNNSVTSIGITPIAEDATATITVNGKTVPSGATSPYVNLDEGINVINVKVTDSKGSSNTYTLNVARRYSATNVNLGSLSVTDGVMSPKFDPEMYLYSVKVARNIEKVRVLFSLQNDKAKIKINGKEYINGQQSEYIKLDIGANNVVVEVTAEDGKSTTTYKLSIIRGDIEGTNRWVVVAGEWTFYNAAGIQIKNQWVKYDNQWYFMDINGYRQTGWLSESGNWYYLNQDGIMQTGWFYDKGYWYYLQGDGSMKTNVWSTYDGKWYYFNNFGELQTGWLSYKGYYYYMDDHGVMQKGWITYDKNKYYINDDGTMRTGWLYSGKVWFYLDDSGSMIRGWKSIDGKKYYFDANGAMKTGMMFLDGQWINLNNV